MKKVLLKSGEEFLIEKPTENDAEGLINLIKQADTESLFLARNPGEFNCTVPFERELIKRMNLDSNQAWFIGKINGEVISMCSVSLIRTQARFIHRAGCAFIVLKKHWSKGIASLMMEETISWCKEKGVEQLELDYVDGNEGGKALYEKYGFEPWGTLKNGLKYPDGSYRDLIYMRMEIK